MTDPTQHSLPDAPAETGADNVGIAQLFQRWAREKSAAAESFVGPEKEQTRWFAKGLDCAADYLLTATTSDTPEPIEYTVNAPDLPLSADDQRELERLVRLAYEKMRSGDGDFCDRPPTGWRCTRKRGHGGPCAAVSVGPDVREGEADRATEAQKRHEDLGHSASDSFRRCPEPGCQIKEWRTRWAPDPHGTGEGREKSTQAEVEVQVKGVLEPLIADIYEVGSTPDRDEVGAPQDIDGPALWRAVDRLSLWVQGLGGPAAGTDLPDCDDLCTCGRERFAHMVNETEEGPCAETGCSGFELDRGTGEGREKCETCGGSSVIFVRPPTLSEAGENRRETCPDCHGTPTKGANA